MESPQDDAASTTTSEPSGIDTDDERAALIATGNFQHMYSQDSSYTRLTEHRIDID